MDKHNALQKKHAPNRQSMIPNIMKQFSDSHLKQKLQRKKSEQNKRYYGGQHNPALLSQQLQMQ